MPAHGRSRASAAYPAGVRIAFVHFPGRLARLDEARAGTAPTEFLFGAVELERAGHEVTHHEVDPAAPVGRLAARAISIVRRAPAGYVTVEKRRCAGGGDSRSSIVIPSGSRM